MQSDVRVRGDVFIESSNFGCAMSDMRPLRKIITLKVEHDASGVCFVTSEHFPEFFLSTTDDNTASLRIESALEHFFKERFNQTVEAYIAEEIGSDVDFKHSDVAKFVASWECAEAA